MIRVDYIRHFLMGILKHALYRIMTNYVLNETYGIQMIQKTDMEQDV